MEPLSKDSISLFQSIPRDFKETIIQQLKFVLNLLETNSMVHGDLRSANIYFDSEIQKLQIIDFDWAGIHNTDKYPLFLNHSDITWPEGVSDGSTIMHAHDVAFCNQIFPNSF